MKILLLSDLLLLSLSDFAAPTVVRTNCKWDFSILLNSVVMYIICIYSYYSYLEYLMICSI